MEASEAPVAGPKSGVQWAVVSEGVPRLAPATTLETAVEKAAAAKMHADREETVAAKARELHQAAVDHVAIVGAGTGTTTTNTSCR